jgi:hypothetical protein
MRGHLLAGDAGDFLQKRLIGHKSTLIAWVSFYSDTR